MQSKILSFMESTANTFVGLVLSVLMNLYVLPIVLGVQPSFNQSMLLTFIFLILSFIRTYVIRRIFTKFIGK